VAVIEVLAPGALTTVQDLGRFGFGRLGVSPGGAADGLALRLANVLVGNELGAAALEVTLLGPRLGFSGSSVVAIAGADLGPRLDGRPVPLHASLEVPAGSELAFAGGARGARAVLAVAGGLEVPFALGSAATDLRGGFGGLAGRALVTGDRLAIGARRGRRLEPATEALQPLIERRHTLRAVRGVHAGHFAPGALARLVGESYAVRMDSDRMGVRLAGLALDLVRPAELLSEGVGPGTVQVPPGGQPIVLGVDHPATGGYPQIAHVIAADLPSLAQLRPRDAVRFAWVDVTQARVALAAQEGALRSLQTGGRGGLA
jgi:antagonist of KipI